MNGWRKRTISEMAREVQLPYFYQTGEIANLPQLEAFAELVRKDERNRMWTPSEWTEYEHNIASIEREACAKVCEEYADDSRTGATCAKAIRARGNT
jgi:hypothetical protein